MVVYFVLTELAQGHVRDHLEQRTPQAGRLPSAVDTDAPRRKGNLPSTGVFNI